MRSCIILICYLCFCACQPHSTKVATSPSVRPNIVFIMTDDHTKQAISAYGSKLLQTPHIDRLAREGIRFNRSFVTNSICAPSRAVMLTGKYSHLNGLRSNQDEFNTAQMTFPKLLQQAGYQTALIGKWHLKNEPTGFDYWNILPAQGYYYNPNFIEMGDTLRYEGYVTNIITDLAIDHLEQRDTTKPFCLLYHHKAPHRNWMPDTKHLDLFNEQDFPLPATYFDTYENRSSAASRQDMRVSDMYLSLDMKLQPDYYREETGTGGFAKHNAVRDWAAHYGRMTEAQRAAWDAHYQTVNEQFRDQQLNGQQLDEWKYQRYMRDYLRCVVSVDENIGRLLDYLDAHDLAENTLVVYTSDQGFYLGEHGWYDKRFMYEESFSMPLIMRYPAAIQAGQHTDAMAVNIDFAPTFLNYAGVAIPADIQGRSLTPICSGATPGDWRESVYYHYYQSTGWHHVPKHYGIRTDRYKLIHFYETEEWELYDLQEDPHELNSLVGQEAYAGLQADLTQRLRKLQREYKDDTPSE